MTTARSLYTVLHYAALPLVLGRLAWRARRDPEHLRGWRERLGQLSSPPATNGPRLWIHAVSVGETVAITELVRQALAHGFQVVFTNGTLTGAREARRRFGAALHYACAPFDTPSAISSFLDTVRPDVAVFVETELWPNWLSACAERAIPTLLANARLSERSARRYRKFAGLAGTMLADLTAVAAQHAADAERFIGLGLAPTKITVTGSVKFDARLDDNQRSAAYTLRQQLDPRSSRLIFIAASTHEGEDAMVLRAFRAVLTRQPAACLILVPRHPERFDAVFDLAASQFVSIRRTQMQQAPAPFQVMVGDTMGELAVLYGASDIALVGGSLVPRGGHNPIEPALWGLPTYMGPHYFNFAAIVESLVDAGGLHIVADQQQLEQAWLAALEDLPGLRTQGERGLAVVAQSSGANAKLWAILEGLLANQGKLRPNTDH